MTISATKNIFKIIVIFIIGTIGGIFADQIFWPYFIERPLFYEYRLEQAPVYLTETNEIVIQENTALQNAFEKVEKTIVGVKATTSRGKTIEGSGIIITSDGLILILAELVPEGGKFVFFVGDRSPTYQVVKRDPKNNLALIKIEETNLPTIGFADFDSLKFGQRVFLVGVIQPLNGGRLVNEGIIKTYNNESIKTNILEKDNLKGSPLFNIEGQLVGLNTIDEEGNITAISINKIREFIGF